MRFHRRCGDRVTLLNDNLTAVRNFVEFNHGIIFSAEPLQDDIMFEICIDRKVNVWHGNLEIGVTSLDPEHLELPATATKLRNTAWIMSGNSIVRDGVTCINTYGPELDSLREGDTLGVMRTSKGELMFFVSGRCLGIAARALPLRVFAVIDLYGQCVQVTIMHCQRPRHCNLDMISENPEIGEGSSSHHVIPERLLVPNPNCNKTHAAFYYLPLTDQAACATVAADRLKFHNKTGLLVKLSNNNRSGERLRPMDDYNNGVVMTHRPLIDNELFEIRIDRVVEKWSGSIEVGVTSHNPEYLRFPSTMTNMDTGTIMMSGCKVLVNGQGSYMEYGNFNLDELREGDTVGLLKRDGKLRYFINGVDQGIATDKVGPEVWGVVDLYGMTVKVTIIDPMEDPDCNINNEAIDMENAPEADIARLFMPEIEDDSLLFHTLRDSNVIVVNNGKTAHRPNAFEYFNNGFVMTNRTLRTNELFQVKLDLVIPKWAGSIEVGITQHTCNEIEFPFKMSNAKSGTWGLTGEDVIRDGTIIVPQYVRNLNKLAQGDTVGVMRRDQGILHFFINGVDQGPAAFNIPEHVFGIIDLYGRVGQATIVDGVAEAPGLSSPSAYSPETPVAVLTPATHPELVFNPCHGPNARLSRNRLTASRDAAHTEFSGAVLFSSRPLRECEMFEVRVDKLVDTWIGGLEMGLAVINPDELGGVDALAATATELGCDTYILSGSSLVRGGECVRSGYQLDLDALEQGERVGIMWHADRSLHYYLNGIDQGKAWYVPHQTVYAVVDLYGQGTQVTIIPNFSRKVIYKGCVHSENMILHTKAFSYPPVAYCFSEYCGHNVVLMHDFQVARRMTVDPSAAVVFSAGHLTANEMFEIEISECDMGYAGGLRMGVTAINILNAHINRNFPPDIRFLPHYTAFIEGQHLVTSRPNAPPQLRSVQPSFEWLTAGDRVGFIKTTDGRIQVFLNSLQLDVEFQDVPDKVYAVIELFGYVTKIQAVSRLMNLGTCLTQPGLPTDSARTIQEAPPTIPPPIPTSPPASPPSTPPPQSRAGPPRKPSLPYTFHYLHGTNVRLRSSDTVAQRIDGYSGAVAIVSQPLRRGSSFRFRVDKISPEWSGGVNIGAVGTLPHDSLPATAMELGAPAWVASSDVVLDNGSYMFTKFARCLEDLSEHQVLTLHFRFNSQLLLQVDGQVLGAVATVPRHHAHVYPLIDVYGRVSQVSVLLHPNVVMACSMSMDLPIIDETKEDFFLDLDHVHYPAHDQDQDQDQDQTQDEDVLEDLDSFMDLPTDDEEEIHTPVRTLSQEMVPTKKRSYLQENLSDPEERDEQFEINRESTPVSVRSVSKYPVLGDGLSPILTFPSIKNPANKVQVASVSATSVIGNNSALAVATVPGPSVPGPSDLGPSVPGPSVSDPIVAGPSFQDPSVPGTSATIRSNGAPVVDPLTHRLRDVGDENVAKPTRHENLTKRNDDEINAGIQKSHSTHSFSNFSDDDLDSDMQECLRQTFDIRPRITGCDTNIEHNDQYPEVEVENMEELIIHGISIEMANLPDLTEEQSSSTDDSTHNDFDPSSLNEDNLRYLHRLLLVSQVAATDESAWVAAGEGCEHLHLVLKFWSFLMMPYTELRKAVTNWGQVRCYCANCHPSGVHKYAGWVIIERGSAVDPPSLRFWHVERSTASFSQAGAVEPAPTRRPAGFMARPDADNPSHVWFDEEGKPHHTIVALEIEITPDDKDDRLVSFLIHLKQNPPTIGSEDVHDDESLQD